MEYRLHGPIGAMAEDGGGITVALIQALCAQANAAEEPLDLTLFSSGGDPFAGMEMAAILEDFGKATIHIPTFAASAATLLMLGAKKITMADGARIMVHRAWSYQQDSESAKALAEANAMMATRYAARSHGKLSADAAAKIMGNTTWLTAQQALEIGLIDKITGQAVRLAADSPFASFAPPELVAETETTANLAQQTPQTPETEAKFMYTPEIIAEMKQKFGVDALDYMAASLTIEQATAKHEIKVQAQAASEAQIAEVKARFDAELAALKADFAALKGKAEEPHTPNATPSLSIEAEMKAKFQAAFAETKDSALAWDKIATEEPGKYKEWRKATMSGLPYYAAQIVNA